MIYFSIILARPVAWHFAQEVGPLRELGILVAFLANGQPLGFRPTKRKSLKNIKPLFIYFLLEWIELFHSQKKEAAL